MYDGMNSFAAWVSRTAWEISSAVYGTGIRYNRAESRRRLTWSGSRKIAAPEALG